MYTEEELMAMNTAQLSRNRSKRGLVPFIIGATAIALLVALIVGVSVVRSPGVALQGYSVSADAVSPIWKYSIFVNDSSPIPYTITSIVRLNRLNSSYFTCCLLSIGPKVPQSSFKSATQILTGPF